MLVNSIILKGIFLVKSLHRTIGYSNNLKINLDEKFKRSYKVLLWFLETDYSAKTHSKFYEWSINT